MRAFFKKAIPAGSINTSSWSRAAAILTLILSALGCQALLAINKLGFRKKRHLVLGKKINWSKTNKSKLSKERLIGDVAAAADGGIIRKRLLSLDEAF